MQNSAALRKELDEQTWWGSTSNLRLVTDHSSKATAEIIAFPIKFEVDHIYAFTQDNVKVGWNIDQTNFEMDYGTREDDQFKVTYISKDHKTIDIKFIGGINDGKCAMVWHKNLQYLAQNCMRIK